jgi:hypothetical protein
MSYLLRVKWKRPRDNWEFNSLPPFVEGTYYYEASALSVIEDELSAKKKLCETEGYDREFESIEIYELKEKIK